MPEKKQKIEKEGTELIESKDEKKRSLDSYRRYKKLNRPMYYRLKYEIRNDPDKKMTIEEWEKLYNKLKF